jgi:Na+-translocating ferredoxin:NAD+ oxidoreductase RnfG subunit
MTRTQLEAVLLGLTLATPISIVVKAEVFFSEDQVVKSIFPSGKFEGAWIDLTDAQVKAIEAASGERVREQRVRVWRDTSGQMVFIDRVIGKHDYITFAVGIDKAGSVKRVEVMEYRETYGHEVRRPEWREQFVGKDISAPLKVNGDIKNISGATLSSTHLTAGVRRILHTYEKVRDRS